MRNVTLDAVVSAFLALLLAAVTAGQQANADVLTVTTTADVVDSADAVLSLREAVADAADGDEIDFDLGPRSATIALDLGTLLLDKNITIQSPAAAAAALPSTRRPA